MPTHALDWHTYSVLGDPPEFVHKLPDTQLPEGALEENVIVAVPKAIVGVPLPVTEICGFDPLEAGGVPAVAVPPKSLVANPGPTPEAISPCVEPPTVR